MIFEKLIHFPDTNSIEVSWVDDKGVQVRYHSYADVQMDDLISDLGPDAEQFLGLIASVRANIKPPVPKPAAQIEAEIIGAIQARLDTFARTRNYDSILSACTYATSGSPKFASEGQACVNLRDATWSAAYTILAAVEAGSRAMPASIGDIESELPALEWPI